MLKKIKMIALNIDGVLLKDTFSPVIYEQNVAAGVDYTEEFECSLFSQNRDKAAQYLIDRFDLKITPEQLMEEFFEARKQYIKKNGAGPVDGVKELLKLLSGLKVKLISYGGMDREYFEKEMKEYLSFFSQPRYICTNDMRPGLREVLAGMSLHPSEVLFVDDVHLAAMGAKELRTPFIGLPSTEPWSHQKGAMQKSGVRHIISNLKEITIPLLQQIDNEAATNHLWQ